MTVTLLNFRTLTLPTTTLSEELVPNLKKNPSKESVASKIGHRRTGARTGLHKTSFFTS